MTLTPIEQNTKWNLIFFFFFFFFVSLSVHYVFKIKCFFFVCCYKGVCPNMCAGVLQCNTLYEDNIFRVFLSWKQHLFNGENCYLFVNFLAFLKTKELRKTLDNIKISESLLRLSLGHVIDLVVKSRSFCLQKPWLVIVWLTVQNQCLGLEKTESCPLKALALVFPLPLKIS